MGRWGLGGEKRLRRAEIRLFFGVRAKRWERRCRCRQVCLLPGWGCERCWLEILRKKIKIRRCGSPSVSKKRKYKKVEQSVEGQ